MTASIESNDTVRTRFAPSPTGYMHIGGMRTALFNWLWARHNSGKFILRIDDTDRQRNLDEALGPILGAFRWLGLDWDEGPEIGGPHGPYFQSQRGELYQQALQKLLEAGKAYYCFDTPEQIQADRAEAEQEKKNYLNIRRSLDLSAGDIEERLARGDAHVVRFLVPRGETIAVDDAVRGHVEWDTGLISDPVICRGDGSPLYNFATVIDDADMQITHVIRAEEHLSNTPIQLLIYNALAQPQPQFVHLPYVAAPASKEKLSKRKLDKYRKNQQFRKMFEAADRVFPQIGLASSEGLDPVMVEYYERIGYLPAAVLNALARLGWSLDDKTEIMSLDEVVENFSLDRIVKSPAGLDPEKLVSFQTHWAGELPPEETLDRILPYLQKAGLIGEEISSDDRSYIEQVVAALGDRIKVFSDILDYASFFQSDDEFAYDEKAFKKRVQKEGAAELLAKFKEQLATVEPFEVDQLDKLMHDFVEAEGIKIGDIIHAVRVAVTGSPAGPGMFDCLHLLGRERCLARIDRALSSTH